MNSRFRRTVAAAMLAALLLPVAAAGQEAPSNSTVGAPELRGFRLQGRRVTPPPTTQPVPPPASTPPAPAAERPAEMPAPAARPPAVVRPSQASPRPADGGPAPQSTRAAPARQAPVVEAAPRAIPTIPLAAPLAEELPGPGAASTPQPPAFVPPGPGSDESAAIPLLWPAAVALGVALLAGLFFVRRRRRAALAGAGGALARSGGDEGVEVPVPAAPAPAPSRRPVQLREEDEESRPELVFEFKPERMVATDAQATVHFALLVRNSGQGPARNVRMEARMFNASPQQAQEIAAFLATPAQSDEASASLVLQPQQSAGVRTSVVMPKESVREIRIEGRPLFIPTVVVRAVYQWSRARSGQAHGSYLVGTQNEKSPEKMGPFRLDLGPRVYRSVGGRQIELARAG